MSDLDDAMDHASIELEARTMTRISQQLNWAARVGGVAARMAYDAMVEPRENVLPVPDAVTVPLLQQTLAASWNTAWHEIRGEHA